MKEDVSKEHTDVRGLLEDVHALVVELGVGKCSVLAHDGLQEMTIGFDVTQCGGGDRWKVWCFFMKVNDFKETLPLLGSSLQTHLKTLPGRVKIAQLLARGMSVDGMESTHGVC